MNLAAVMLAGALGGVATMANAGAPLVQVSGAWIRPAVKGQSGTGGFMSLSSRQAMTLTGFRTPVASSAELHEMNMQGDVMRMQAIDALPLPAGQTVALQPGGHHLMLMGLKRPLPVGVTVPLTLILRTSDGRVVEQKVKVPVRSSAPASQAH
ncbi:MAG: copper chaperone PCu(A)C [Rubrivivax sp.]|nr:MAG: copper chaperone PCu(A)C [Rubrivivax sp.]